MKVLDRYLIRMVMPNTLAVMMVLLLLFSAYVAVDLLRSAAFANLGSEDLTLLVFAHDLSAVEVLLPTAFFATVVAASLYWHARAEPYALYAASVSPDRVSLPLRGMSLVVALLVLLTTNVVRPYAYQLRYVVDERASNLSSEQMQPQQFYYWDENFVIQAQRIRKQAPNLEDVFAYSQSSDRTVVLKAERGHLAPTGADRIQHIYFFTGTNYEFRGEDPGYRTTTFSKLEYLARRASSDASTKRRAQSNGVLAMSENPKDLGELQWRICLPIVSFLVSLMGIELGRLPPRRSPYGRVSIAILLYIGIFNAFNSVLYAVQIGTLPVTPGLYSVPALLALAYLGMRRLPMLTLSRPR